MSPNQIQIRRRNEFIKKMKKELEGCQSNSHFLADKKRVVEENEARLKRLEKLLKSRSKDKEKTEKQIEFMRQNLEKLKNSQ